LEEAIMGRVTRAFGHLSEEEIRQRIREAKTAWTGQKWLVILHATVDPIAAKEIALHVGVGKGTVHNLISDYNRFGPDVVEGIGRGGRRNSHMTREEEAEFVAPFIAMAEKGQIVVGSQIGKVLEERLGCTLHHSIIYRLLDRNGWRKVVPRPCHTNSKKEVQEEFKKKSREK